VRKYRARLGGLWVPAGRVEPELEQVELVFVAPPAPPSVGKPILAALTTSGAEPLHL